ncbi:DUF732 domain-containing protein [Mycobacterium sp. MMS18-G62]
MSRSMRFIGAGLATGALLLTTAAPAEAWPIPLTPDQTRFLNAARGNFPGDDDQLLLVGEQMCHLLYSGQPSSAVIETTAGQYGASPDQTAVVLRAARRTLCTQAPG